MASLELCYLLQSLVEDLLVEGLGLGFAGWVKVEET